MAVTVRRTPGKSQGRGGPVREKCRWWLDKLWPPNLTNDRLP